MAADPHQQTAIQLIGDFSKWIAAVETATLAAIGVFLKSSSHVGIPAVIGLGVTVVCFVVSIVMAAGVLISLPAAIQDMIPGEKVWDRVATIFSYTPLLRRVVALQLTFFALGICGFGASVLAIVVAAE